MKYFFTFSLFLFSFFSFSQVITFECNNELITVSIEDVINNPNVYIDWNEDDLIDENDYLIYLLDAYGCDDDNNDWGEDDDNDWDGDDDNDWGEDDDNGWDGDDDNDNGWGDVFTFECNGEEITIELTNEGIFKLMCQETA